MKKFLFVCMAVLVINQNIFSQNDDNKWTIQTSPLLLFSDLYIEDVNDTLFVMDLEGQYKLSKNSNISLTLSFLYIDHMVNDEYYDSRRGRYVYNTYQETYYQIGLKPMYIHRPFETGLKGFYIGIYPNFGFRYDLIDNENPFYLELGFGLDLGYKWVFNSGFTMQVGGGIGKTFSIPSRTYRESYINSDGRITVLHTDITILDFKIGYSF
jgi:hypothetical protein